jgi:hypothetical protein
MAVTEEKRQRIHEAIDQLPSETLDELDTFIRFLHHRRENPGSAWFRTAYELFEPVRESAQGMSEDEINQIIDEAIDEVQGDDKSHRCD